MPDCRLIRSGRRTLALEVTAGGELVVRAPWAASRREILAFVDRNRDWIGKKLRLAESRRRERESYERKHPVEPLSREELRKLAEAAAAYIPMRVAHYAAIMGVDFGMVTIRNQRTRWGSCSSKGNLNFNCLLMLTPPEVIDSVIVHELCHRRHMDHSKAFYEEVLRFFPEYHKWDRWLKENGGALLRRIPK